MEDAEFEVEVANASSAMLGTPHTPRALPRTFKIAVLPGDGIGPEVMAEALRVLDAAIDNTSAVHLAFQELPAGAGEYLRHGDPLPAATLHACEQSDTILMGAMG